MSLLNRLFHYVLLTTTKYGIDESHGLSHSMNILHFASKIYESEVFYKPHLIEQQKIIYVSAIMHDMCDKKYMNENEGIKEIENYLINDLNTNELSATKSIITTMSYSKVKKDGFPNLGVYQDAYHIVRESDLLTAYDFDRSMIYHMKKTCDGDILKAFNNAEELFHNRVFQHNRDRLFLTEYSKKQSITLEKYGLQRINYWKKIINNKNFV
jgi:HD superfamily phosphodiesterase